MSAPDANLRHHGRIRRERIPLRFPWVTDRFIDVNRAWEPATRAGWGRIHGKRIPATKATDLGKYLSKERPPCFKGWRLCAAFGKEWSPTKVANLEKRSAFGTAYQHFAITHGWFGKRGFFKRIKTVNRALDFQIRTAAAQGKAGRPTELRQKLLADGRVLLL